MSLSKRVVETLLDLVEIKLSCFEVYDREDSRELAALEQCKRELLQLGSGKAAAPVEVVAIGRRAGRPSGRRSRMA